MPEHSEAKIIYKGNSTAVGDADVHNDRGRLVAKALSTYMVMAKKP
jgi:acyl-coenzyme A thioesterase PaaI-like protein